MSRSVSQDFYAGILYSLICLRVFDQPTMTDEIINTLSDDERKALIRHAKRNEEYELSGLADYEKAQVMK